jgi:hypothetical protein
LRHLFIVTKFITKFAPKLARNWPKTGSNRFSYHHAASDVNNFHFRPGRYLEEYNELAREHNQFVARMPRPRQPRGRHWQQTISVRAQGLCVSMQSLWVTASAADFGKFRCDSNPEALLQKVMAV